MIGKYFLPFCRLSYYLFCLIILFCSSYYSVDCSIDMLKCLNLTWSHLSILLLLSKGIYF